MNYQLEYLLGQLQGDNRGRVISVAFGSEDYDRDS